NATEIRFHPGLDSSGRVVSRSSGRALPSGNGSTVVVRGRAEFDVQDAGQRPDTLSTVEFISLDSVSQVHVEALQDGRVIASGDGTHLAFRRVAVGVSIEAWSHVRPGAPPPDSTSARLVELELQRVASSTDSASMRRLDSEIATLHDRLRGSPGGVAADRE